MAALGNIGKDLSTVLYIRPTPPWAVSSTRPSLLAIDIGKKLTGIVTVNTVVYPAFRVDLHYRETRQLINTLYTNDAGVYEFKYLDSTDKYYVVFLDDLESAPYNFSLVRDHLTPG